MELCRVQPGDTLYDITLSHKLSMGQFLSDNGLNFQTPAVGQPLLVQNCTAFHMVRTGETLPAIAAQHGLTPEALNRLNPGVSRVFPGQRLTVGREAMEPRPAAALLTGTEEFLIPLPLLAPEERTGRQYEHLHFEEEAERTKYVLLRTPEDRLPVPLPRLRSRLEAALALIPREKLVLELDGLGRDGSVLLSREQAEALAASHRAAIRFHPAEGLAHFRYADEEGREHRVKFPDLQTLRAQLELVRDLGLSGVALPRPSPAALLLWDYYFAEQKIEN